MNSLKTLGLMLAMTMILVLVGSAIGGRSGMVIALVIAGAMNFAGYWFSDRIVLAMYGAQPVDEAQVPGLYAAVRELANQAAIPMPKVYVIQAEQPNAFATGRDPSHAAVAVTQGLLRILNQDELQGVLAHELAHVKHRDILVSTIAATLAGAIMVISRIALFFGGDDERGNIVSWLLALIVAPIAAMLVQMAISRSREYGADAGGASISGKPWALASALRKLEQTKHQVSMDANPATAHMFIVSPFTAKGIVTLFSTHPSTEDRIARLEQMR
jgi:heat shock protein HtpX